MIYIYRAFHPKAAKYTFFSSAYGTFSRTDHIVIGHKVKLSQFNKTEIISSKFSDHNEVKLENNYKKKLFKHKDMEAKQYATKKPIDHWRNERGNQKIPKDKWKHNNPKPMGGSKEVLQGKFIILPQETRKISNKQPNLTPKTIREGRTTKPKVRRNYKDQSRNKWNKHKENHSKDQWNNNKSWFFEKINKISQTHQGKKWRQLKSIKLEIKKREKVQ